MRISVTTTETMEKPTVEELLQYAEHAEQTMRDVGVFDPAYIFFLKERDYYLALAIEMDE